MLFLLYCSHYRLKRLFYMNSFVSIVCVSNISFFGTNAVALPIFHVFRSKIRININWTYMLFISYVCVLSHCIYSHFFSFMSNHIHTIQRIFHIFLDSSKYGWGREKVWWKEAEKISSKNWTRNHILFDKLSEPKQIKFLFRFKRWQIFRPKMSPLSIKSQWQLAKDDFVYRIAPFWIWAKICRILTLIVSLSFIVIECSLGQYDENIQSFDMLLSQYGDFFDFVISFILCGCLGKPFGINSKAF